MPNKSLENENIENMRSLKVHLAPFPLIIGPRVARAKASTYFRGTQRQVSMSEGVGTSFLPYNCAFCAV